jgi:hypothetical protein
MNFENLLNDIEIFLEINELRKSGLSEEEILGYFELYTDEWIKSQNASVLNEN